MSRRLPLISVLLAAAGAAWWGASAWSGANAPELRRPEGARAREVTTVAAGSEAETAAAPPAIAAIRGETRRAAALVDLAAAVGPRKPFVLRVVAAGTTRDLRGVTVRRRSIQRTSTEVEMPAGFEELFVELAQGDSPLTLAPPAGEARVDEIDVACAGHDSRRLRVEWTGGGERRIELVAAGKLRLSVRDAPQSAQLEAHLFEKAELPPIGNGQLRGIVSADGSTFAPIGSLGEGRWRVELFDRGAEGDPLVGSGEAIVVGGAEAKLELAYVARPLQALVSIAGRVVLDRAWFDGASEVPVPPTRLRFWQPGRPSLQSDPALWDVDLDPPKDPAVVPFDGGLALPGLLVVGVDDWECTALVEVPVEGSRDLEVLVPPPADVFVTVRDVATGMPLEGVSLSAHESGVKSWRSRYLMSSLAWSRRLGMSDADGRIGFRMTAGEAILQVQNGSGRDWRFRFVPGFNEVELTVGEFATLSLLLRDGDAIVPWGDGATAFVEAGGQRCFSRRTARYDDLAGKEAVDADGPVQVHVDGVEGYEPSERFDVSLVRGESVAVEIPLRRRN